MINSAGKPHGVRIPPDPAPTATAATSYAQHKRNEQRSDTGRPQSSQQARGLRNQEGQQAAEERPHLLPALAQDESGQGPYDDTETNVL
jgi:hypothetical protein